MGHQLTISGRSDIGRVRRRNEDSLGLAPELGVAVVADGMGGHPGGDVASRIATDCVLRRLRTLLPAPGSPPPEGITEALRSAMAQSVLGAHHAIRHECVRNAALDGMGTTLTAMAVELDTGAWVIGHAGDSRAFRLRGEVFEQLTRDDTWVQKQVEASELTPAQARRHPFGHVLTQCLGLTEPPEPQLILGHVEPGDLYLLCTDGLGGMVDQGEIAALARTASAETLDAEALDRLAHRLVGLANERGGYDNVTVAVVAVGD